MADNWSVSESAELYGINLWGQGYFRINEKGNVAIYPFQDQRRSIDLCELTEDLRDRGIRVPIMIRFPDIIRARIELINKCFANAIQDHGYKGLYRGVYPIKVNQQHQLVEELVRYGREFGMGLECGSKPELLVVLAMATTTDSLIICNGFKDSEYIETAILSQKLGRNTIIVVDAPTMISFSLDDSGSRSDGNGASAAATRGLACTLALSAMRSLSAISSV